MAAGGCSSRCGRRPTPATTGSWTCALLADLQAKGLLDETLVVLSTELHVGNQRQRRAGPADAAAARPAVQTARLKKIKKTEENPQEEFSYPDDEEDAGEEDDTFTKLDHYQNDAEIRRSKRAVA